MMKRCMSLLLALLVMVTMTAFCVDAADVTYVGGAEKFVFDPGTEQYPTDLFSGFKDVMPGDTLTEQILIQNKSARKVKVKVYLRALGAQEDTEDFLSQMNLTVQQKEDSTLFEGPADEKGQLSKWTYLGTVKYGGKMTLDVTLEVPITMGNEFQDQVGYVGWEFKIEEIPDPDAPATSDASSIVLYTACLIASLLALIVLLYFGKRQQRKQF